MAFSRAFYYGMECALELAAEDLADQPNETLWERAITAVGKFAGYVPPPLVTPLQLGGLSVEWHSCGLDLELRFRVNQQIFALIDDARGELQAFQGRDPELVRATEALDSLALRSFN